MINSTDIFNGEYTDMGFELIDNHLFIGDTDLSNKGYNQKEIYTVYLNLKYRDKDSKELKVMLNYDDIDINSYKDTIIYLKISDKNDNIIKEKERINIINDKIILIDDLVNYSNENYQYRIYLEFYNKYEEGQIKDSYELANRLSADLI